MSKNVKQKYVEMKNCLYQRFYIIGIDCDLILSESLYRDPFSKSITPKILSKFPPLPYSYCIIPDQLIIQHCFPDGYSLTDKPPKEINQIFSFALDNFPVHQLDDDAYETAYFTCNLFYESLKNCYTIKEKYYSLKVDEETGEKKKENKDSTENKENKEIEYSKIYVPKIICLMSMLPFYNETSMLLKKLYSSYSSPTRVISIPIEKQIEDIIFSIPIPPRGQYIFDYHLKETIPFRITPINRLPNPSNDLQKLFEIFEMNNDEMINIFKCLLLEVPMVFFSSNKGKLTNVIESLLSLLYPLKYSYPHIAILPSNCYSIIDNFNSFVLGINEKYSEEFFVNNNIKLETKRILLINLDTSNKAEQMKIKPDKISRTLFFLGEKEKGEETMHEPQWENIEPPAHHTKKLIGNITKYLKKINFPKKQDILEFNSIIREEFYQFIFTIILEYSKYLLLDNAEIEKFDIKYINRHLENMNINEIFMVDAFLKDYGKNCQFYHRFLRTRIFFNFIVNKLYPKTLKDKLKILLLDEKIIARKNKNLFAFKVETPFIDFQDFLYWNYEIAIKRTNNYNTNEYIVISSNLKKCLKYFQDISITSNENSEMNKTEKIFNTLYPIFPKLLYDNQFFPQPYEQICIRSNFTMPDQQLQEVIKKCKIFIEDPKYSRIYLQTQYRLNLYDKSKIHKLPMRKYVELAWLFTCAGTLWYCDKEERDFRVHSIFEVLDNITYIDNDILIYVFLSLIKWGKDYQVIRMYEIMEKYDGLSGNYTLFSLLCMKMTKIYNSKKGLRKEFKPATLISRETDINIEKGKRKKTEFKKRSILLNKLEESEEIKFENVIICPNCKTEYKLDFTKFIEENCAFFNEYLACPMCKPKGKTPQVSIRVMIGNEISQLFSIQLYNPYFILESLRKKYLKNEDYKIDIETMRVKKENLYFNLIFFFALWNMTHDFIIPYVGKGEHFEKRQKFFQLKIESRVNNECYYGSNAFNDEK